MRSITSRILRCTAAAAALAAFPSIGSAQIFTPTYQSPVPSSDAGLYLSDTGGTGVEAIFRRASGGGDFGVRVGALEFRDQTSLALGVELRRGLPTGAPPLRLGATASGQAVLGDASAFGVQGGLSIGAAFPTAGFRFIPYVHPRVAFVSVENSGAEDDSEIQVLTDVGLDVELSPRLSLRVGGSLSDYDGIGIGFAFR